MGTNVAIHLSTYFLKTRHLHTAPNATRAQTLRTAYMLAVTILHELAHAVYMCRFPAKLTALESGQVIPDLSATNPDIEEYEPFYSDRRKAELDHAWETSIFRCLPSGFGGQILSLASSPSCHAGLAWQCWPSASDFMIVDPYFRPSFPGQPMRPMASARLCRNVATRVVEGEKRV